MALYVASHYKNSPNDLQLMADAPAHHLFVLLGSIYFFPADSSCVVSMSRAPNTESILVGPVDESKNQLPDILCVIQVLISPISFLYFMHV